LLIPPKHGAFVSGLFGGQWHVCVVFAWKLLSSNNNSKTGSMALHHQVPASPFMEAFIILLPSTKIQSIASPKPINLASEKRPS